MHIKDNVKPNEISEKTRYIGLEHIDRKCVALQNMGDSSEVTSNKHQFHENDILFGKLRPYFHKVCFTSFAGICSTDILVIRPIKPHYFCFCLFAFFQSDVVEYANLGSGGTKNAANGMEFIETVSYLRSRRCNNKKISRNSDALYQQDQT